MDMRLWAASQTGKSKTELDWQNRNINEVVETPPGLPGFAPQPKIETPKTGYAAINAAGDALYAEKKENDDIDNNFNSADRWAKRLSLPYRLGSSLYDVITGKKTIGDQISQNWKEVKSDFNTADVGKTITKYSSPLGYVLATSINETKKVPDSEDIEMEEMEKLRAANAADLKEMPGKAGEKAHNALHKTVGSVLDKMDKMHPEQLKEDPTMSNIVELGAAGLGGAALYAMLKNIMQARKPFGNKSTGYEVMKNLIATGRMQPPGQQQTMPGIPLTPQQQDALQQQMAAREILRDKAGAAIAAASSDQAIADEARGAVIQAKKETASSVNPRPVKPQCPNCGK